MFDGNHRESSSHIIQCVPGSRISKSPIVVAGPRLLPGCKMHRDKGNESDKKEAQNEDE